MHRNVTVLVIVLSVLVVLGYIIWLKNKILNPQPFLAYPTPTMSQTITSTPTPFDKVENPTASISATPISTASAVKNTSPSATIKY